jgi:hypothetical protein
MKYNRSVANRLRTQQRQRPQCERSSQQSTQLFFSSSIATSHYFTSNFQLSSTCTRMCWRSDVHPSMQSTYVPGSLVCLDHDRARLGDEFPPTGSRRLRKIASPSVLRRTYSLMIARLARLPLLPRCVRCYL